VRRRRHHQERQGARERRRSWVAAASLLAVASFTGCIGSQTREQFEEEMHLRGGGLSQRLVADAVGAVEERLHVDEVKLRSLDVSPGRVAMEIQVPQSAEDLDGYDYGTSGMYGGGGLSGPEPVARSFEEAALEAQVFTLGQAGADHLDDTVDAAVREADLPGGYATAANVVRLPGQPAPQTSVTVTNVRRTVTVVFAPDGTVTEVQR
jgi:hypothetical protein